ncbi:Dihydropteroate synthase [Desulfacinum hydrothermale DSM 13146]|uniref:Dihydropteroate synthase n=1 Tax=Desulfacinum hydrothermale DSM 13146 TaxID=1121390 RepID=A0A1W1X3L0_9BACT|nr:dihydropteroate synthase [Desulfacinum hydrothermale]SMC18001.1 Dihydropteroate synthase [Desulfacinum hydrothermale DSM 13146]
MTPANRPLFTLKLRSNDWTLGHRTLIMGIVNVTPDSFSDGGRFASTQAAVRYALELVEAGADILDIGGESTRPFSDPVPLDEELERVVPVVQELRSRTAVPISVDTTKAEVARRALEAGADIINDVSALRFDPEMAPLAAETGVPVIVMHMLGTPKTMQQAPVYQSLLSEVTAFLEERLQWAVARGIDRNQIIVDPGIGFGKTVTHNLRLIRDLDVLSSLERPILLGASRKRFIGAILDRPVEDREVGTAVAHAFGVAAGAHILRVHDVRVHKQVALMADALRDASWREDGPQH